MKQLERSNSRLDLERSNSYTPRHRLSTGERTGWGSMVRQPTMDDVAAEAGVSRSLVSLVMRNAPNVSEARRVAVLAAADQLGYRPNVLARNLASRRTFTIGVLINDMHNAYHVEVLDGMEPLATANGYRVLIAPGWHSPASERRAVESILEYRVDGLILAGPQLESKEIVQAAENTPVVIVGRSIRSTQVDSVNNDEAVGTRLVVDHLVGLGHSRITHFDGGTGAGAGARRAGYEAAMRHHGLDSEIDVVRGDFTESSGATAAATILGRPCIPTAIFAANDLMAAGALDTLEEAGLHVPEDISLVGYDNTALAAMPQLSLSTVHQPRIEMGRLAMESLLERIDGRRTKCRREVIAPQLMARTTSGPLRKQPR